MSSNSDGGALRRAPVLPSLRSSEPASRADHFIMHQDRIWLPVLLLAVALAGCSGAEGDADRVEVYPVTGKVTFNGAPVADATVSFSPKGEYPAASGRTDSEGVYSLTTYETEDGAAAGDYAVLVIKDTPAAAAAPSGGHAAYSSGGPAASHGGKSQKAAGALPEQYRTADRTPLQVTVKADGENEHNLTLEP